MQAVFLCETFLPSPAPDFCPPLLSQGFGYCFKSNERSFVAVEQLFPKLEAPCLPPLVISVGSFTSPYKSLDFCNTSSSLRTGDERCHPSSGVCRVVPHSLGTRGTPAPFGLGAASLLVPSTRHTSPWEPCQERSQAWHLHPIPDTDVVLGEPSRRSALSKGQTPAFTAVPISPHVSSCPLGKAA